VLNAYLLRCQLRPEGGAEVSEALLGQLEEFIESHFDGEYFFDFGTPGSSDLQMNLVFDTLEKASNRKDWFLNYFSSGSPGWLLDTVNIFEQRPEDWIQKWKDSLKPFWLSDSILIDPFPPEDRNIHVLKIVPGMAFGTGDHPTTRLAAAWLDERLKPGDRVLDIGCGTGILSLSAVLCGASFALGTDIDPQAVRVANECARENDLREKVQFLEKDLLQGEWPFSGEEGLPGPAERFDLVVANIIFPVLRDLLSQLDKLRPLLKPSASFVFSGVLSSQKQEFSECLEKAGLRLLSYRSEEAWCSFFAQFA